MSTAMALKPKQLRFAQLYVQSGNATQAAIDAGYSGRTARVIGPENLQKPAIAAEVARLTQEYARTVGVTTIDVWKRLKAKAFTDITEFMDDTGGLKAPKDWPEAARAAISAYDAGGAQSSEKLRLVDQTPILLKFAERLEPTGPLTPSPGTTTHVQVNIDKLLLQLHAPLPAELREG